jgi:curved DNA-binding protein CbpA
MNHYERLGVSVNATKDEIHKAFRNISKKFHPDKAGNNQALDDNHAEVFKLISEADVELEDE